MTLFNIDDTRRATGSGLGDVFKQGRRRMQLVREQAGYLSDDLDFNLADDVFEYFCGLFLRNAFVCALLCPGASKVLPKY